MGEIRFNGRPAIVTGAGAGLGRSHALLLAARGARVVVNDPAGADDAGIRPADRVVEEIRAAGGEAIANYDSVADRDGAAAMVQQAVDSYGSIDIVVNNAGVLRDKTFVKLDLDDFELVLKVHLLGTLYVTKAAWPHMLDQKYGRIVLTTSGSGLVGSYGQSNYGTAKAAMVGLANNLKNEGRKAGVLVNLISPVAATAMTQGMYSQKVFDGLGPEHVSPAVAWLCSDQCDVTGHIVAAGGGYYSRIQLVKSQGAIPALGRAPTVEEFGAAKDAIFDMSEAQAYNSTLDEPVMQRLGLVD